MLTCVERYIISDMVLTNTSVKCRVGGGAGSMEVQIHWQLIPGYYICDVCTGSQLVQSDATVGGGMCDATINCSIGL